MGVLQDKQYAHFFLAGFSDRLLFRKLLQEADGKTQKDTAHGHTGNGEIEYLGTIIV